MQFLVVETGFSTIRTDTTRCRNANTQTLCVASSGNILTPGFPSTILESGSRG